MRIRVRSASFYFNTEKYPVKENRHRPKNEKGVSAPLIFSECWVLSTASRACAREARVTFVLRSKKFLLTSKLRYLNILSKTFVEAQSIDVQGFVGPPISRESSRRQTECQRRKKPRRKRSSSSGREARFSAERDLSPASPTRQNQAALTSGLFCVFNPRAPQ